MPATILILEDDTALRENLAESLEDSGYTVAQAEAGVAALALLEARDFDLFITDVRMAGIDGLATLARARELRPELKSIVITGYADTSAPTRAVEAETLDYLYKPFSLKELESAVKRALGAEAEERRYSGLLARIAQKASDVQLQGVDKERDRTFRGYYVAVRSRLLAEAEAFDAWSDLLTLESQRESLKSKGFDLALGSTLGAGYRALLKRLSSQVRESPARLPASPLQRTRFALVVQGVTEGRISLEQLKLAPLLSGFRHETLRQEPELEEVYQALWGSSPVV